MYVCMCITKSEKLKNTNLISQFFFLKPISGSVYPCGLIQNLQPGLQKPLLTSLSYRTSLLFTLCHRHVSCGPPVPTLQPSYSSLTLHTCCFSLPRTSPHSYFLGWLLLIFIGLNLNIKFSGGRLWSPDMVRYPDTYSHWFSVLIKILFYY